MPNVGIRRETKSPWERRVAVTPELAATLVQGGHEVFVERSDRRVFDDADYEAAGCKLVDTLPECSLVFGVKEIPSELLTPKAAHLFFAHVIKAQPYNMPMLAHLLSIGATLLDYERITDEAGKRLVFFGRFAGLAGMIDALWTLGARLEHEGHQTPFSTIRPAHEYASLEEGLAAVSALGETLRRDGVPDLLHPLVIGVTGGGNVARGVHQVLDALGTEEIAPEGIADLVTGGQANQNAVYRARFLEEHLVRRREGGPVEREEYFAHPDRYESAFGAYHPHLSVLMNGIYWTEACPRLVLKSDMPNLKRCYVIGDISCDVEGSIEATLVATEPGDPVFTYDAEQDAPRMGVAGSLPVINAVDILPAELPRDASESFASALAPYALDLAGANYEGTLAESGLPGPLQRSCIAWRGELTEPYAYLKEHI